MTVSDIGRGPSPMDSVSVETVDDRGPACCHQRFAGADDSASKVRVVGTDDGPTPLPAVRTAGRWDLPRVSRTSSCAFLAPERGTSKSRINPSPPTGGEAIVVLVDQVVACGDFMVKRDARRATRCGYPLRRTGATTTRLAVWAKNHLFANSTSTR
jgi:hypothetical protein